VTGREPFEYALIRVVPRVERGEVMNAGVILYSQHHKFLECRIRLDENRLRALDPEVDLAAVTTALSALETECRRAASGEQGFRHRGTESPDGGRWLFHRLRLWFDLETMTTSAA